MKMKDKERRTFLSSHPQAALPEMMVYTWTSGAWLMMWVCVCMFCPKSYNYHNHCERNVTNTCNSQQALRLWWSYCCPWQHLLVNWWCDWPLICHPMFLGFSTVFQQFCNVADQRCMTTTHLCTHTRTYRQTHSLTDTHTNSKNTPS